MHPLRLCSGFADSRVAGLFVRRTVSSAELVDLEQIDPEGFDRHTYTVRRVFARAGKEWIKGVRTNIYGDQVGEAAYEASCFRNVEFGGATPSLA
jgi:hypothetical protein